MALRTVILREATAADLRPLAALARKVLTQIGIPHTGTRAEVIDRFRKLRKWGCRVMVLYEGPAMLAALAAIPIRTDAGAGYEIVLFLADRDDPNPLRLLDAVSLYSCHIAISERRYVVVARHPRTANTQPYGRDYVGMAADDQPTTIDQYGDARWIAAAILRRRPEWRISL